MRTKAIELSGLLLLLRGCSFLSWENESSWWVFKSERILSRSREKDEELFGLKVPYLGDIRALVYLDNYT
ncbi:hypothetical protein CR513_49384, partial [Mucuna pruriens]